MQQKQESELEQIMSLKKTSSLMQQKDFEIAMNITKKLQKEMIKNKMSACSKEFNPFNSPKKEQLKISQQNSNQEQNENNTQLNSNNEVQNQKQYINQNNNTTADIKIKSNENPVLIQENQNIQAEKNTENIQKKTLKKPMKLNNKTQEFNPFVPQQIQIQKPDQQKFNNENYSINNNYQLTNYHSNQNPGNFQNYQSNQNLQKNNNYNYNKSSLNQFQTSVPQLQQQQSTLTQSQIIVTQSDFDKSNNNQNQNEKQIQSGLSLKERLEQKNKKNLNFEQSKQIINEQQQIKQQSRKNSGNSYQQQINKEQLQNLNQQLTQYSEKQQQPSLQKNQQQQVQLQKNNDNQLLQSQQNQQILKEKNMIQAVGQWDLEIPKISREQQINLKDKIKQQDQKQKQQQQQQDQKKQQQYQQEQEKIRQQELQDQLKIQQQEDERIQQEKQQQEQQTIQGQRLYEKKKSNDFIEIKPKQKQQIEQIIGDETGVQIKRLSSTNINNIYDNLSQLQNSGKKKKTTLKKKIDDKQLVFQQSQFVQSQIKELNIIQQFNPDQNIKQPTIQQSHQQQQSLQKIEQEKCQEQSIKYQDQAQGKQLKKDNKKLQLQPKQEHQIKKQQELEKQLTLQQEQYQLQNLQQQQDLQQFQQQFEQKDQTKDQKKKQQKDQENEQLKDNYKEQLKDQQKEQLQNNQYQIIQTDQQEQQVESKEIQNEEQVYKYVELSDLILIQIIKHRKEQCQNDIDKRQKIIDSLPYLIKIHVLREQKIEQVEMDRKGSHHNQYENYNNNNKNYKQKNIKNNNNYNKKHVQNTNNNNIINRQAVDLDRQRMEEKSGEWLKKQKEEEDEHKKIKKEISFNLNLLTPDNYEKLKDIISDLALTNKETMQIFIQLILEKAWEDKLYVKLYASLCNQIYEKQKEKEKENLQEHKFKNLLLTTIQEVFEQQKVVKQEINKEIFDDPENNADLIRKQKRRILGNIKFIGELYIVKLLPSQIINHVSALISLNFIRDYYGYHVLNKKECQNYENHIEAFVVLIDRIGQQREKNIETDFNLSRQQKLQKQIDNAISFISKLNYISERINKIDEEEFQQLHADLNQYDNIYMTIEQVFDIFKLFQNKFQLQKRTMCLIEILNHKKQENWKESGIKNEGPKKMDDIRKEHDEQQQKKEEEAQEFIEQERSSRHNRQSGHSYHHKQSYDSSHYSSNVVNLKEEVGQKKYKNSFDNLQVEEDNNQEDVVEGTTDINAEEKYQQLLKALFQQLDKTHEIDQYVVEVTRLAQQCLFKTQFISAFLNTYYDGNEQVINNRLTVLTNLFQLDQLALINSLNKAINDYYHIYIEFPFLIRTFAHILVTMISHKIITLDMLIISISIQDENHPDFDEDEFFSQKDYFRQLIENILKSLIKLNLSSQYNINIINQFCQQTKQDDTNFVKSIINKK